jgi:signal transduction histidine kinase
VDTNRLPALLAAGRALVTELDSDAVLQRLLDVARELTGARYAAIGVMSEDRTELERFITAGIDEDVHQRIGDLPRGRGVLGVLIDDPQPLRLRDVGDHPLSYGFPPEHPPMATFLGVPILMRGQAWGNLYLTDKPTDFTADDEETVVVLAEWAAVAIANARSHTSERSRRGALEIANRALETTTEVTKALGGVTDIDRALELIVKRSRALVGARSAEIAMVDGEEFIIAAAAGEGAAEMTGMRLPIDGSIAAHALRTGRAERYEEIPEHVYAHHRLHAQRAIVTPMIFKSVTVGVLVVLDRIAEGNPPFTADDQRLVEAFAASGATAIATAQSATDEALRRSLAASEAERGRWARELHDETLQDLAALRMMLSAARRSADPERLRTAIDDAVELIGGGIHNLRALIADLRPAALDELGVKAALEALVERVQQRGGIAVDLHVDLELEEGRESGRLPDEIEAAIYRLVQEALNNVVKHADARRAGVRVIEDGTDITVEVVDDGKGFDPDADAQGFGLVGMRERVAALRGSLAVESTLGQGSKLTARFAAGRHLAAEVR